MITVVFKRKIKLYNTVQDLRLVAVLEASIWIVPL